MATTEAQTINGAINESFSFVDPNERMTFINSTQTLAQSAGPNQTLILANDSWMTVENSVDPLKVVIQGADTNITMADFGGNMNFLLRDQGAYTLSTAPRGGIFITTQKSQLYVMGITADNLAQHIRSV